MFDMMLGPLGETYWQGPAALPKAQLHHDWSRVAFPAAAAVAPLDAFSYGIGTQQPAAITAAIGATPANIFDTSITKPDALSRDCIATHLGVKIDNVCLCNAGVGADIVLATVAIKQAIARLVIRVFYAERSNEEFVGKIEDLPEGKGIQAYNAPPGAGGAPNAFWLANNGTPHPGNIRPLPQPLPCEGGKTYFRVTFEPTVKGVGVTMGSITSLRADVYGIMPMRTPPIEASGTALQALARLK